MSNPVCECRLTVSRRQLRSEVLIAPKPLFRGMPLKVWGHFAVPLGHGNAVPVSNGSVGPNDKCREERLVPVARQLVGDRTENLADPVSERRR